MTDNRTHAVFPVLANASGEIIDTVLHQRRRVLLYGPPGSGKSVLAAGLARALEQRGRDCWCLSADPGSPAFGVPGAVSLGRWTGNNWRVSAFEGLATLDAGRFRLPLLLAVQRLLCSPPDGVLLIDAPGVVRGVAGRELLTGLLEGSGADAVLALTVGAQVPALVDELSAAAAEVFTVPAVAAATRPGTRVRARRRTEQWDAYLGEAAERSIDRSTVTIVGTPPPPDVASAWTGRQAVLLKDQATLGMAEVLDVTADRLTLRLPAAAAGFDSLLIRNATRTPDGVIETAPPFAAERLDYLPPGDRTASLDESGGPRVSARVGALDVSLVNGVFGDPLLHLRLRHRGRSLLFDLGQGTRLSARVAHQVSDVFVSHAHMDHIGGFLWLLRSRIGAFPACRLYGPPGLAQHIAGFIRGILWDRVGETGPCFEVAELHADRLQRVRIQAGREGHEALDSVAVAGGVIREEAGFRVRAVALDHQGVPVLAYAFEPERQLNIRKDRLLARGLAPGPWLNELKQRLLADNAQAGIQLPDGSRETAAALGAELVLVTPGKTLAYATDLADTPANRERVRELAQRAHTFFCEAPFLHTDSEQARRTGHLTARACGEIAAAAGVARLVPFHFSRRYTSRPQALYAEIQAVCSSLVAPGSMAVFGDPRAGPVLEPD